MTIGDDLTAFFRRATMRELKMAITLLRKKIKSFWTPSNEPESSHYGRRSMVPEPYLDHKKSYGPLKFLNPLRLGPGDVGRNISKSKYKRFQGIPLTETADQDITYWLF